MTTGQKLFWFVLLMLGVGAVAAICSGCSAVPDSVNYTLSIDHDSKAMTSYFGSSWNIPKPTK